MDLNFISANEIDNAVLAFGYLHISYLWYTFDDEDQLALRRLKSDKNVIDLINKSFKEKRSVLNVYVEHVDEEAETIKTTNPPLALTSLGPSQDVRTQEEPSFAEADVDPYKGEKEAVS